MLTKQIFPRTGVVILSLKPKHCNLAISSLATPETIPSWKLEHMENFEISTFALEVQYSASELHMHKWYCRQDSHLLGVV